MKLDFEYAESVFEGKFKRIDFKFEERDAILALPSGDPNGKWLFKTEYFGAFPQFETEMLENGYCVAHIRNTNRWGLAQDTDMQYRFACFLHREVGLNEKCLPVGMSCGGMFAIKLAARYPQIVAALYLDAPVVDLLSCPMNITESHTTDKNMQHEMMAALGLNRDGVSKYREHPFDMLPQLVKNKIPAFIVAGDADMTVPFSENGRWVERAYKAAGVPVELFLKSGCDHHPHGLYDNAPLIRFVQKYYK